MHLVQIWLDNILTFKVKHKTDHVHQTTLTHQVLHFALNYTLHKFLYRSYVSKCQNQVDKFVVVAAIYLIQAFDLS